MSKNLDNLSVERVIKFNRGMIQITTKRILNLKQECQIASIAIVTRTSGIQTSIRQIIKTSLTSNKQYIAQEAQAADVALICLTKAAYNLSHAVLMTNPILNNIMGLNKRLQLQLNNLSLRLIFI